MIDRIAHYGNLWNDGSSIYVLINEGQLGETPWERRDRYIENLPISYLGKVQTPLLMIQATCDPAARELTSDGLFVGLRHLGKEVEYAKYEGEGHVIQGYANQVDCLNRIIAWFDKYLKAHSRQPDPTLFASQQDSVEIPSRNWSVVERRPNSLPLRDSSV